jgi:hypothetical protein
MGMLVAPTHAIAMAGVPKGGEATDESSHESMIQMLFQTMFSTAQLSYYDERKQTP